MALKFQFVVVLVCLSIFGFAREPVGEFKRSEDERSLLSLLAEANEPPQLARFQVFPRDDILTVTLTETVCKYSASGTTPVVPTSSGASVVPSSSSISSSTPVIPVPSSTTPFVSTSSSAVASSSSPSFSSILSPSAQSTSQSASSTATDVATTDSSGATSSAAPPQSVAFRQTGMHTGIVVLLALINIMVIQSVI